MSEAEFRTVFSSRAEVEHAWLQSHRSDTPDVEARRVLNHRGFGFVIFRDEHSVGRLLGNSFSGFLEVPGDRRLEVKRAVSSKALSTGQAPKANVELSQGSRYADVHISLPGFSDEWETPWSYGAFIEDAGTSQVGFAHGMTQSPVGFSPCFTTAGQHDFELPPTLANAVIIEAQGRLPLAPPGTDAYREQLARILRDVMPDRYDD